VAVAGADPTSFQVARGKTVVWWNVDVVSHRARDVGLGLVDTGQIAPGDWATYVVGTAGAFDWRLDGVTVGTIGVPVVATPSEGTEDTAYTVAWSSEAAPTAFVFDVQIRKPGADAWKSWRDDVTTPSSAFHPGAGPGTYRFRARIVRVGTGAASGWSPADAIGIA
jgi:hypothetical protein